MPKDPATDPNQGQLFVTNEQTGMIHPHDGAMPPVPPAEVSDPLHDPNPGPSVNILERNAHMQNVLRRLGGMSRTTGLQFISETGQRRKLEERYDDVDRVVGGAAANQAEKESEAKEHYFKAFGLEAIVASGTMSKEDASAMATRSYQDEVLPVFADAKGAKNRGAMKSWLTYQENTLTGKRTRRPKAPLPKPPEVV